MENIGNIICIFSVLLIAALGVYLSFKSYFFQLKALPDALKNVASGLVKPQKSSGGLSSKQAMCTALAATIGTGNVAGISGAVALAGPGVIFWVWVSSFLAMIIKYYEIHIAMLYRQKTADGYTGGTMYAVKQGLSGVFLPLAFLFALSGTLASFGTGNLIQVSTIIEAAAGLMPDFISAKPQTGIIIGIAMAFFIGFLLLSGIKTVGRVCERVVPLMLFLYVFASFGVIILNYKSLPEVFALILKGAFSPGAVTGGAVYSMLFTLQTGVIRGIVSNEAGLGTATVAHSAADTADFIAEGKLGIAEVFIDGFTCTLTAVVVLLGNRNIEYGFDNGSQLILKGFANTYGGLADIMLSVFLILFGVSSVLGWGAYGIAFCGFLWGKKGQTAYKLVFSSVCVLGAVITVEKIWSISELLNSVMSVPNIIAVFLLSPQVTKALKKKKTV